MIGLYNMEVYINNIYNIHHTDSYIMLEKNIYNIIITYAHKYNVVIGDSIVSDGIRVSYSEMACVGIMVLCLF